MRAGIPIAFALVAAACGARISGGTAERPDAGAPPTGIAAFARHARLVDAQISPKGTYLALVSLEGGRRSLVFEKVATREVVSRLELEDATAGNFFWANDERVVVELIEQEGALAHPVSRGELYAVDADGTGGRLVFGFRAGGDQVGSHIRRGERDRAWGLLLDSLTYDDRRVLMTATSWDEVDDRARVFKLDVYTGVKTFVTEAPMPEASLLTDEEGEVRIAVATDATLKRRWFHREPGGFWKEPPSLAALSPDAIPVEFAARDRTLHVIEPGREGFALVAVPLGGGPPRVLARDDLVEPSDWILDLATNRIVAVEWEPDLPRWDHVDPGHPVSRVVRALEAAHPGRHVRVMSRSDDDSKVVVWAYSDRDPGEFLLVDVATLATELIGEVRPWIDEREMAETKAFHIAASDGLGIHGYVTLPRARGEGPPPLVVLPHGGPHGTRDTWGFDSEVQLLASEGFAVLQVNYRGSIGYGDAYEEAGHRRWGDRVVQDIVDATRWALRQGYGDPARVCAFGLSFGAYAALQGAILAPDLFRCAVGYSGMYDLEALARTGEISETRLGRGYLRTAVGTDRAALRAASPVHNADRLVARVLLAHGRRDQRAPLAQAERMRRALVAAGRPPEWHVERWEGHGFYDEAARERLYARVVAFLKESTASVSAPPAAPAIPAGPARAPGR
jgi:dipeptidyl aminopeptidase/acylaminoacyl peptidase